MLSPPVPRQIPRHRAMLTNHTQIIDSVLLTVENGAAPLRTNLLPKQRAAEFFLRDILARCGFMSQ